MLVLGSQVVFHDHGYFCQENVVVSRFPNITVRNFKLGFGNMPFT